MVDVFASASRTIAWLGSPDIDKRLVRALWRIVVFEKCLNLVPGLDGKDPIGIYNNLRLKLRADENRKSDILYILC
jgi:hypothetical protein